MSLTLAYLLEGFVGWISLSPAKFVCWVSLSHLTEMICSSGLNFILKHAHFFQGQLILNFGEEVYIEPRSKWKPSSFQTFVLN